MIAAETDRARDALQSIPPDLPREDWVRAGMAAQAAGLDFDTFNDWSAAAGTLVKEVVVAIAAIATVVIAAKGLETWRRELTGKAQFEAAKGLARATYKLRNELTGCRSPFIHGHEFPEGEVETANGWAKVMGDRWESLWRAVEDFDAAILEAEALWGDGARTAGGKLRACVQTLFVATESLVEDKRTGGENFKADPGFGRRTRVDVFASSSSKDNPLSNAIAEAVAGIEKLLLPHLSRR